VVGEGAVRDRSLGAAVGRRAPGVRRLVVVALTALAVVLVVPILVKVYAHAGTAFTLSPAWMVLIGALVVAHFSAVWALQRLILRTDKQFDVAAAQLAANATSHVAPAGSAVGAGLQLRMLSVAGFPASQAATAMGAAAVLGTVASYVVLPLVVLAASAAGSDVPAGLVTSMWSATAVLAVLLATALALARRDEPWRWIARIGAALGRLVGRPAPDGLGERLLRERDAVRAVLRGRAGRAAMLAVAQPLTDYAALLVAVRAVGAHVGPATILAAFVVSNVAGLVPFTPGGLGLVEAGLGHVLALGGASRPEAHAAVATYRLAATWLPCLAGFVALMLFHRRRAAASSPGGS
jgi:uncharacterized protein (TIRG00374 family)